MGSNFDFRSFLQEQHQANRLVIFPTGMGSELGALGAQLDQPYNLSMPLWAVGALRDEVGRSLVRQVHMNAATLGMADVITSATWMRRTALENVIGSGWEQASEEIFGRGVKIMIAARNEVLQSTNRRIWTGGSFGPLMDSHQYVPGKLLAEDYLFATHKRTAEILVAAAPDDLDFLIPETACNFIEAWTMARAASSTGKPFIIGLTPGDDGHLRDGYPLDKAVDQIGRLSGFTAIGINCVEIPIAENALARLRLSYDGPVVVYANGLGKPAANGIDWDFDHSDAALNGYRDTALGIWAEQHKVVGIGGCCGTLSHTYGRSFGTAIIRNRLAVCAA